MRRRYLIELRMAKKARNNLNNIISNIILQKPIRILLRTNRVRMKRHIDILNEILKNRPNIGLGENLLGLILSINMTMIHEINISVFELHNAVFVRNDLLDVL